MAGTVHPAQGSAARRTFLLAASDLRTDPAQCTVVEDAYVGIDAALAAGMKAFGVGHAPSHPGAHGSAPDLSSVTACDLLFTD
ncbi:MAG TPA: HAD-IA family hydrolase [Acidimicrobiia bacterium]|nr:HAD-IA family hydrolase [Acidimicrobiia bacterium]